MRLEFSDEPVQAFTQVQWFHWAMVCLLPIFLVFGEFVHSTVHEPEGHFIDVGDADWLIRAAWLFYAGYTAVGLLFLYKEKRMIEGLMRLKPLEVDATVTRALTTMQILRSALSCGIAVTAFSVFVVTGDRVTLYAGSAISLALLILFRPTRVRWEAVFNQASVAYPGVSASPW